MHAVSTNHIQQAISILGRDGITDKEIESEIANLVSDKTIARRLIDWIPEAFATVLIPHIGNVNLPETFTAKTKSGKWVEFNFKREPIFINALPIAMNIYHAGPRATFANIANRSSMLDAVNSALNAGDSIDGAQLSGPALIGIPAETYENTSIPFWRSWFGGGQES